MANRIVQAIYDLKDNVSAGLKRIGAASSLRNAITPYLPSGYTWPVAVK